MPRHDSNTASQFEIPGPDPNFSTAPSQNYAHNAPQNYGGPGHDAQNPATSATQFLDMNSAAPGVMNDRRSSKIGRVKLIVEQGRILGEQFLLNEHDIIIGRYDAGTGRCPDIDLSAQDPAYVHRQHARLRFDEPGEVIMLFDLGGRNGAYVNNRPLDRNGSAQVRIGDKIRIGRVVMRLQPAPEMDRHGQSSKP